MIRPLTAAAIAALELQRAKIDIALAALRALESGVPVKKRRGRPKKIHAVAEPQRAMRAGA
jgi:hypothetical protein